MTENICGNCGYSEELHKEEFRIFAKLRNIECPCKKFQPQNQTQDNSKKHIKLLRGISPDALRGKMEMKK